MLSAVFLLASPTFSDTLSAPRYQITDLGTLPGETASEALALNDKGEVVGVCSTGGLGKSFLWEKGVMAALPTLPGADPQGVWPRAINDHAQIVGTVFGTNLDTRRAFLIDNGAIQDLGTPPGEYTEAFGINDKGQIVGQSYSYVQKSNGEKHIDVAYTFIWDKATGFHHLSTPANDSGENVSAINNSGQVIGASMSLGMAEEKAKRAALPADKQPYRGGMIPSAAVLWQKGQMRSLSPAQSWSSGAIAINGHGDILGRMSLYPDSSEVLASPADLAKINEAMRHSHHAFLWKKGQVTDLGEFSAAALNDADDIVGTISLENNGGYAACVWREGELYKLTDLISSAEGWVLQNAVGINNHGQIIGTGTHNGQHHAYLLTPY